MKTQNCLLNIEGGRTMGELTVSYLKTYQSYSNEDGVILVKEKIDQMKEKLNWKYMPINTRK